MNVQRRGDIFYYSIFNRCEPTDFGEVMTEISLNLSTTNYDIIFINRLHVGSYQKWQLSRGVRVTCIYIVVFLFY